MKRLRGHRHFLEVCCSFRCVSFHETLTVRGNSIQSDRRHSDRPSYLYIWKCGRGGTFALSRGYWKRNTCRKVRSRWVSLLYLYIINLCIPTTWIRSFPSPCRVALIGVLGATGTCEQQQPSICHKTRKFDAYSVCCRHNSQSNRKICTSSSFVGRFFESMCDHSQYRVSSHHALLLILLAIWENWMKNLVLSLCPNRISIERTTINVPTNLDILLFAAIGVFGVVAQVSELWGRTYLILDFDF